MNTGNTTLRSKSILIKVLTIVLPTLLFGGVGYLISSFFIDSHWIHIPIKKPPVSAEDLRLLVGSTTENPTGDTLLVVTSDGETLSFTLFEHDWKASDLSNQYIVDDACAPVWLKPADASDAELWNPPPVKGDIFDSVGVRFERPLSMIARCYVIMEDGRIEMWTRSADFLRLMYGLIIKISITIAGAFFGAFTGFLIISRKRRNPNNPS
jgi:hypothetical protein